MVGCRVFLYPSKRRARMTAPTVSYADCTYEITLTRNTETTHLVFGEHMLSVCAAREDELSCLERAQIKGPCADDGFVYYIHAEPYDFPRAAVFVWLKDKAEALALNRELRAIHDAEDEEHGLET